MTGNRENHGCDTGGPETTVVAGAVGSTGKPGASGSPGGRRCCQRFRNKRATLGPKASRVTVIPMPMAVPVYMPAQHSVRRRTTRWQGTAMRSSSTLPAMR